MKKNLFVVPLLVFMLSGCGASATPLSTSTSTQTSIPTPTQTPSPLPTSTITVTPEATATVAVKSVLDWNYINEHSIEGTEELNGVVTRVRYAVDSSIEVYYSGIKLRTGWQNNDAKGTNAQDSLTSFVQKMFYSLYQKNSFASENGLQNPLTFEDFLTAWSQAQQSGTQEDWDRVKFWIWGNDRATPHKLEKIGIYPMYFGSGNNSGEGHKINEVIVVVVNGHKMNANEFEYAYVEWGSGGAVDVYPEGKLVISVAPAMVKDFPEWKVVESLTTVVSIMSKKSLGNNANRELMEILGNTQGFDIWSTAFELIK